MAPWKIPKRVVGARLQGDDEVDRFLVKAAKEQRESISYSMLGSSNEFELGLHIDELTAVRYLAVFSF